NDSRSAHPASRSAREAPRQSESRDWSRTSRSLARMTAWNRRGMRSLLPQAASGKQLDQVAQHLFAVGAVQGQGELCQEQPVANPDVVSYPANLKSEIAFLPGQLRQCGGELNVCARTRSSDRLVEQTHDGRREDVDAEQTEVIPRPQAGHNQGLLGQAGGWF